VRVHVLPFLPVFAGESLSGRKAKTLSSHSTICVLYPLAQGIFSLREAVRW
jgi:hypothetical protein